MKKIVSLISLLMFVFALSACFNKDPDFTTVLVLNPYENIDWDSVDHVLTNLHTHTTNSDGQSDPHDVVDYYNAFGYRVLAIADHYLITHPWNFSAINPEWEDRNPEALGMIAIPAVEYTYQNRLHHMVALFTSREETDDETVESALEAVHAEENSIIFFAHPGRYWRVYETYEAGELYSPEWYQSFFEMYPLSTLIGLEVFSRDDRHPYDRGLWDILLTELMPARPIWGLGNDDYHGDRPDRNINWSFTHQLIAGELTAEKIRTALIDGTFYTSFTASQEDSAPMITRITINTEQRYIEIEATDYESIQWVSGADAFKNPIVVGTGNRFYYGNFEGNYVRAEIIKVASGNSMSVTLTQPFGFTQSENE